MATTSAPSTEATAVDWTKVQTAEKSILEAGYELELWAASVRAGRVDPADFPTDQLGSISRATTALRRAITSAQRVVEAAKGDSAT